MHPYRASQAIMPSGICPQTGKEVYIISVEGRDALSKASVRLT